MKIGELAKRAGVSVDTLRFYEKRGLISAQRSASGYRHYTEQTQELVQYIKLAQGLGFTLAQIGENLPLLWQEQSASQARLRELFVEKIAALDARIAQTQALRDLLALRAQQHCPMLPA